MILRPPKNYNEYSVSVPMSIDWMLKTLWRLNTGGAPQTLQQVTDAGNTTTNTIDVAGITTDFIQMDTAATPTLQPGMFGWNDAYGTADLRLKGNNVTLQIGQETLARVVNKTGADLLESQYKAVRVRVASEGGAAGQRLAVVLAQGNNDPDSTTTLGIVTENIANNQEGFITVFGNVNEINTTGSLQGETWVDGDVLFLSPTTPGSLTKVKPTAPNHTVVIGYVVYAHANHGKIFVKVDNGYELEELHDVLPTPYVNKGVLYRDTATNLWKSATIDTLLGGTPLVAVPTLAQVTTAGNTTTNDISVGRLTVNTSSLIVFPTTFNVGINTTTDAGFKLDVNGTARVSGTTNFGLTGNTGFQTHYYNLGNAYLGQGYIHLTGNGANALFFTMGNATSLTGTNAFQIIRAYINEYGNNLLVMTTTDSRPISFRNGINGSTTENLRISSNQILVKRQQINDGSITASSALAQGVYFNNTLVAAANNDVLVGLDINPTFTNGAFTGVKNYAVRVRGLEATILIDSVGFGGSPTLYLNAGTTFATLTASGTELVVSTVTGTSPITFMQGGGRIGRFFGTTGNLLLQSGGTFTDAGQKLQVSGKVFIKGTTSLTATKVFEVQNGAGESIMDFRDSTYAFFGCGQGGGSATGFIFNYSNTSYCQFSGYNYGAGAGAYKPILLDTDIVGRGNGVFVNFGVSTNPPPNSDTEFGVRGRTSDTMSFIARFRNSSNTDMFAIRADGALYTDSQQGYSGTLTIPGNPPGSTTITITNGLITNIA